MVSATAIQWLVVGSNAAALALMAGLDRAGLWVPAIRPRIVPAGTTRLSIARSAGHEEPDVELLQAVLKEAGEVVGCGGEEAVPFFRRRVRHGNLLAARMRGTGLVIRVRGQVRSFGPPPSAAGDTYVAAVRGKRVGRRRPASRIREGPLQSCSDRCRAPGGRSQFHAGHAPNRAFAMRIQGRWSGLDSAPSDSVMLDQRPIQATSPVKTERGATSQPNRRRAGRLQVSVHGLCGLRKAKAAYSGLPFGASFSLLASRAHFPIILRVRL